jgi:hypothetical protein
MKKPTEEEKAFWYRKLRKTKFNADGKVDKKGERFIDIEGGIDTQTVDFHTSTFSGDRFDFFEENHDFGEYTQVQDTDQAIAFRELANVANELPSNYKHRAYLIDVANTGCHARHLREKHKLTIETARWAWKVFCDRPNNERFRNILIKGKVRGKS